MDIETIIDDVFQLGKAKGSQSELVYSKTIQGSAAIFSELSELKRSALEFVDNAEKALDEALAKLAESESEIKRLESAWHVETMSRKDRIIGNQEAENDRLRAKMAAVESEEEKNFREVCEVFYLDASAWYEDHINSGELPASVSASTQLIFEHWLETKDIKPVPADKPERITEQDAMSILLEWDAYRAERSASGVTPSHFKRWMDDHGRTLLNKLNADREQVPAVVVVPDVSTLVEAMERIANMDSMSYHSLDSAKITARAALAAHRKGGGK